MLLDLIFDEFKVPVSDFPLLVTHASGPEDAVVVDLALMSQIRGSILRGARR